MSSRIPAGPTARVRLPLASLWLAAAVAMLPATVAFASHEPPRLSLTPVEDEGPYFDLTLDPGESVELRVEIRNSGHESVLARTYIADVYSLVNGGFGAELHGKAKSGPSRWVDFQARELALAQGVGEIIEFVVSVPPDAQPGEYITSLVAENAEPYRAAENVGVEVDQVNRNAIAIAVDVPGPRDSDLAIGGVTHKPAAGTSLLEFAVINAGHLHLRPSGELSLRRADGEQLAVFEAAMGTVYAGTETLLEVALADSLAPGDYCAELRLADQTADVVASTECLDFAVFAAQEAGAGGLPPVLGPIAESVADNALAAGLAALVAALTAAASVYAWRRRRNGHLQIVPADAAWPGTDPLNAAPAMPPRLSPVIERALITPLRNLSEVHRAWVMRHDSYLELAVEMTAGTGIAQSSAVAQSLRTHIGGWVEGVPLRVVVINGRSIIARRTEGQPPVYVQDVPIARPTGSSTVNRGSARDH